MHELSAVPGILGVGTDLLECQRIRGAFARHGLRFVHRILSPEEVLIWQQHPQPDNYLAKAFAAKEALSKALGTGIAQGVSFQDFTVTRQPGGRPLVSVNGRAAEIMRGLHAREFHLSLSDDAGFIQAFAVLSA